MGLIATMIAQRQQADLMEERRQSIFRERQQLMGGLMGQAPVRPYEQGQQLGQGPLAPRSGSGLLADPWDPVNQMQFGAGLMTSPGLESQGSSIFNQVLAQQGQAQRLESTFVEQRAQNDVARQDAAREFDASFNQDERHFQQGLAHKSAMQQDRFDFQGAAAAASRLDEIQGPEYGNVPAGEEVKWLTDTGNPNGPPIRLVVPSVGTERNNQAREKLQNSGRMVADIDEVIGLLNSGGLDFVGKKSGRLAQLYGNVISGMGQMRDLGTLQPGDIELLQSQLPDPSSAGFKLDTTALGAWAELRETVTDDDNANKANYRWYPGIEDVWTDDFGAPGSTFAPPGTVPLSEAASRTRDAPVSGRTPPTTVTSPGRTSSLSRRNTAGVRG